MKKVFAIFALASVLYLNSCSNSDPVSSNNLNPGSSKITCSISGAVSGSFASDDKVSRVIKSSGLINISGGFVNTQTFTSETVIIILSANVAPGSYNLKSLPASAVTPSFTYSKMSVGWVAAPSENDFTVVVTKATATEIEGTFSGKANNDSDKTEITISNGSFAAKY